MNSLFIVSYDIDHWDSCIMLMQFAYRVYIKESITSLINPPHIYKCNVNTIQKLVTYNIYY